MSKEAFLISIYRETIKSMKEEADSVEETQIESQAETVLKPIVRQIDKSLRLTLLPDPVDIKLLNTELYQEIVRKRDTSVLWY